MAAEFSTAAQSDGKVGRMPRTPDRVPELANDSVATVIDRPARPHVAEATTTSINNPLDALAHAELLRTRRFAQLSFPLAMAGLISLAYLPGERIPTIVMFSAVILAMAGLAYFIYRTRDPSIYKMDFGLTLAWYVTTLAVCSAVPYYGPYTPVSALLVFGVYITSMGQRFELAIAIYLTCAIVQGVTGSLAIFGIADPGFIKGASLSLDIRVTCQVLVQVVLLGSFLTARGARQSSLSSLGELERAVRSVAQRQTLLEEAREELRRALGTGRGRFTGQQIGRYYLGEVIGRGAMGEVYASVDPAGEPVAVKMLAHASLGNPQHVQRFLRELRTSTAIASPNVVRVFEVGEEPLPFLVMERLTGSDLAAMLRAGRVLPHDGVIDLVRQVGAGITAAGAAGIIHRDLKPQNLMLDGETWKVLDFGVARLIDAGDTLTSGHIVGTPAYMAPEQARGEAVTHRTDLYALAAIAYRALTGQTPHVGGEPADVLYRVAHTAPRRPGTLATLPRAVDLVLAIGLAKDPADRFATAADLADALATAFSSSLDEPTRVRGHRLLASGAWSRDPTLPPAT